MVKYHPKYLPVIVGVMVLCLLDAFLTLGLLDRGGTELNPIVNFLIGKGTVLFLVVKTGVTVFGVILLLVLKDMRIFGLMKTGRLIYAVLSFYTLVILYELYLYIANQLI